MGMLNARAKIREDLRGEIVSIPLTRGPDQGSHVDTSECPTVENMKIGGTFRSVSNSAGVMYALRFFDGNEPITGCVDPSRHLSHHKRYFQCIRCLS